MTTISDRMPAARAHSFAAPIAEATVLAGKTFVALRRSPDLLFYSLVQPVVFICLFAFVFGGAIRSPGMPYAQYLIPGIMVQMVLFGSVAATATGVAREVQRGVMDRYRSLPISRSSVLVGRQLAEAARNVLSIGVMLVAGYAVGFRLLGSLPNVIAAIALLLAFGFAFSWLAAFIGVSASGVDAAQGASMLWLFPFTFLSSAFVPVATMPPWLAAYASHSPVTVVVNTLRTAFDGGDPGGEALLAWAWTIGIAIVFVPLTLRRFSRPRT